MVKDEDDDVPTGLLRWRTGVEASQNSAQLMLCLQQLDANIAWEKSIMRAVSSGMYMELEWCGGVSLISTSSLLENVF